MQRSHGSEAESGPAGDGLGGLVSTLWRARSGGLTFRAPEVSDEDGRQVLRHLLARAVGAGDTVVGWKVGRVAGDGAGTGRFVGPVLASARRWREPDCYAAPRVEVEFVARIDRLPRAGQPTKLTWHVGLEVIDNHDDGWRVSLGWALADWGLNAAVTVGDACGPPPQNGPLTVILSTVDETHEVTSAPVTSEADVIALLDQGTAHPERPYREGDCVWTGSLIQPLPVVAGAGIEARVPGYGGAWLPSWQAGPDMSDAGS